MVYCWFRFLVQSAAIPQLLQVSAADPRFRSHFLVWYDPGVFQRKEPHGQVCMTLYMVRVLSAQPNWPSTPLVNVEVALVKRQGCKRWHGSACSVGARKSQLASSLATKTAWDKNPTADLLNHDGHSLNLRTVLLNVSFAELLVSLVYAQNSWCSCYK